MRNDFSMIDMNFVENTPSPLQKKEITRWYSAWNLNMSWQNIYHLDFSESACKQKTFGGVGLSQNRITISNLVISKKHNHLWMPFCAILFCFVFNNRILPYYTNHRALNWSKEINLYRFRALYYYTLWKFQDFSATQILREINFGHFEAPKTAIFTIWAALG